jgi:hypothetical protein
MDSGLAALSVMLGLAALSVTLSKKMKPMEIGKITLSVALSRSSFLLLSL